MSADVILALAYARAGLRPGFSALFGLDAAIGRVVAATREPMVGQVRLAWWRDNLINLQSGKEVAPEPVLQALAKMFRDDPVPFDLSVMVEGWNILLDPLPLSPDQLAAYAQGRGGTLFSAIAGMAGSKDVAAAAAAGCRWALADFGFRCSDSATAALCLDMVNLESPPRTDVKLLSILGNFATRDCALGLGKRPAPGSPLRAWWALRMALFTR